MQRPKEFPKNPHFASGPTSKRPGWDLACLEDAYLGRSHRATGGMKKLRYCLDLMRELLAIPDEYLIGIVPASDTGAIEMAMWNLLGENGRGVDVFAWEVFGYAWLVDVVEQLKLSDVRVFKADYGDLPDLSAYDNLRDCVLAWNGTTSGVRVPNSDWISDTRQGLVLADSTSAVFGMPLPFERLDVVTFSWQKSLGGEGGHGVIILSPRAVERVNNYTPAWGIPKILRLKKDGSLDEALFKGATINTPSMLCVEDALDALLWAKSIGGREALFERVKRNFEVIEEWVKARTGIEFAATDPSSISPTSMVLKLTTKADDKAQRQAIEDLANSLEAEGVAFDIKGHAFAPPYLRIWGGPTVEASDLVILTHWLDWGLDWALDKMRLPSG